jgi:hypothetical protein
MKVLAGMIVYDRKDNVDLWMRAWHNADKMDAKLIVVHNYDGESPPEEMRKTIESWGPDFYYPRKNSGQDIGAFRDVLRHTDLPWDVLFWATDDNVPVRKDFLKAFVKPFEEDATLGLLGNHWVKGSFYKGYRLPIPDHVRTCCFAIRREAAMELLFPARLANKWDCYTFEWADVGMNMTAQVERMGYSVRPICGDRAKEWVECNEYVWDIGCIKPDSTDRRCRKDYREAYERQFE